MSRSDPVSRAAEGATSYHALPATVASVDVVDDDQDTTAPLMITTRHPTVVGATCASTARVVRRRPRLRSDPRVPRRVALANRAYSTAHPFPCPAPHCGATWRATIQHCF